MLNEFNTSKKCKLKKNARLFYLTYHFMQTSIMNQLQILLYCFDKNGPPLQIGPGGPFL